MKEREMVYETHRDLAWDYAELIREFCYENQQPAEGPFLLPRIVIPRVKPRQDSSPKAMVDEAANNPYFSRDGGVISGILPLPSAHTPAYIIRSRLESNIYRNTGQAVHFDYPDRMPAQLTAWVWDSSGNPVSPIEIAAMNPQDRKPYIQKMSDQMHAMTKLLCEVTDTDQEEAERYVRLYFVFGNTDVEEQKKLMLAPGVQTNKSFHVHATYFPDKMKDQIERSEVSVDDFLKHLGPMDTLWHRKFKSEVIRAVTGIVGEVTSTGVRVGSEENHSMRNDFKGVANYEGYSIRFDEPVHSDKAFEVTMEIINQYNTIHEICMHSFEAYHKAAGHVETQSQIRQLCIEKLEDVGFALKARDLTAFVFANRPTYGQISTWLEEKDEKGDVDEVSEQLLRETKVFYEARHEFFSDPVRRPIIEQTLMNQYRLSRNEAKLLFRVMQESYAPRTDYKDIKFNISARPSGSFLLSEYEIKHDGVWVQELSFATRQEKGVVEDLAETNLSRDKGKR